MTGWNYRGLDLSPLFPSLGYTLLMTAYIVLLRPSLAQVIGVVVIGTMILSHWKGQAIVSLAHLKMQVTTIFTILFVYSLYHYLGVYGILGLAVATMCLACYLVWRRWHIIKPLLQWWEREYTGMTAEERRAQRERKSRRKP